MVLFMFYATSVLFLDACAENTGNNVVSCAACRTVELQVESYKCDINCNFVGTINGEWLLILFVLGFKEIFSHSFGQKVLTNQKQFLTNNHCKTFCRPVRSALTMMFTNSAVLSSKRTLFAMLSFFIDTSTMPGRTTSIFELEATFSDNC